MTLDAGDGDELVALGVLAEIEGGAPGPAKKPSTERPPA